MILVELGSAIEPFAAAWVAAHWSSKVSSRDFPWRLQRMQTKTTFFVGRSSFDVDLYHWSCVWLSLNIPRRPNTRGCGSYMFDSCQFYFCLLFHLCVRFQTRTFCFIHSRPVHPLQCFFFSAWLIFYPHVIISTPSTCAHTAALFCRIRYKLHVGISTVHGV